MKQLLYERSRYFSTRKVSVELAVRILNRNGIRVNKENAQIILDFLYRIARTFKTQNKDESCRLEPREEIEPLKSAFLTGPMHYAQEKIGVYDSLKKLEPRFCIQNGEINYR